MRQRLADRHGLEPSVDYQIEGYPTNMQEVRRFLKDGDKRKYHDFSKKRISEQHVKSKHILTFEITDPEWGQTYTAYIRKKFDKWNGWIPYVPEVDQCEEGTQKALLTTLKDKLSEALEARADAWDKQIEEDIKAGRLEHLRKEALEDIKAGRFTDL